MITLDRPSEPPQVLLTRGSEATHQDSNAYVENPAPYCCGEEKFKFRASIYGSTGVKEVLQTLQNNKCGYCESKPGATSAGRIDHFRPKKSVRQGNGSERLYPGYYWLAYRWDNLVLACETCNARKSDYFPLEDPGQRARSHLDCLDREAPVLLNPYGETNVGEHLAFNGSACRPETERGRVTVKVLGLNRPKLQEDRQYVLNMFVALRTVAHDPDEPASRRRNVTREMKTFAKAEARFSAMICDYLSAADSEIENRT